MPRAPAPSVRQLQKAETRARLLDAARGLLRTRGVSGTTARAIADAAGVSVGTVFLHFASVGLLVETLLDEQIGAALDRAWRTLPPGGLVDELVHVAATLYDSYDVDRDLSRLYLSASLFEATPGGPAEARLAELQGWVAVRIAAAARAGEIPPIEPAVAFAGYFSIYFGVLVAGLRGQLDRTQQLATLRGALARLFAVAPPRPATRRRR